MTAYLLPVPKLSWRDANGLPLVGGVVETYVPGTTTLKDTWSDRAQTTLNPHPIVLDSRGETVMWGNGSYRLVVKDKLGNLIYDQLSDVSVLQGDPGPAGPSAPGSFFVNGADPSGVADSSVAIQAAINAAAAAGGGTVYLPEGTFKIGTTLRISTSGVKLQGVGRGAPHDIPDLSLAPTKIIWGGANGGTMIACGPVPSASVQKLTDIAVIAVCLVSGLFPYTTAAGIGLLISSVQNSLFDVTAHEFGEAAVAMTITSPTGEAANNEGNTLSLRFRQINMSGTALQLGGINGVGNTCHNLFPVIWGYINNGIGIDFQDADNNRMEQVWVDRLNGGAGINLFYRGTGAHGGLGGGRTNVINQFSQSVHPGLIFSEGFETAGVTQPAFGNRIEIFDGANVGITTQTGTGASFYWASNIWGGGMREALTGVFNGRRQLSDGFILFWGTFPTDLGENQVNHIILDFGCSRILDVSATAVGNGNVGVCCNPDETGNGFTLFSPVFGRYRYRGYALA